MEGWIKINRKIEEWEWFDDPLMVGIFVKLILKANFKDKYWGKVLIKRGQFISSFKNLSDEMKLSIQQLRSVLSRLKSTNNLTSESTNQYTLYTIVNYELFQDKKMESTNKITNKITNEQQTSNKRATTREERKERKKENIYPDDFEFLWVTYERNGSKKEAYDAYKKLKVDQELHKTIYEHILKYKADKPEIQYRKHFNRYLKNKLWEI